LPTSPTWRQVRKRWNVKPHKYQNHGGVIRRQLGLKRAVVPRWRRQHRWLPAKLFARLHPRIRRPNLAGKCQHRHLVGGAVIISTKRARTSGMRMPRSRNARPRGMLAMSLPNWPAYDGRDRANARAPRGRDCPGNRRSFAVDLWGCLGIRREGSYRRICPCWSW